MPITEFQAPSTTRGLEAKTRFVVGVDLGGTKTTLVAATGDARIAARTSIPTPHTEESLAAWLSATIRRFVKEEGHAPESLQAVGIGVPGSVDLASGEVFLAPNLGWNARYPLRGRLEEALSVPVLMDNDVNMAAVGEQAFGAARSARNFVFVAVGTGLGAGIVIDGKLYRGSHWTAGEIGYMTVSDDCPSQVYTDLGYLERVASGRGIAEAAQRAGLASRRSQNAEVVAMDAKGVFAAAARGEAQAQSIVDQAETSLALGLVNIIALMDPELIVIGGGVALNKTILEPIRTAVRRLIPTETRIVMSELGAEAQVLGAAATALAKAG